MPLAVLKWHQRQRSKTSVQLLCNNYRKPNIELPIKSKGARKMIHDPEPHVICKCHHTPANQTITSVTKNGGNEGNERRLFLGYKETDRNLSTGVSCAGTSSFSSFTGFFPLMASSPLSRGVLGFLGGRWGWDSLLREDQEGKN